MNDSPVWLRTDKKAEAINALQEVKDHLNKIETEDDLYSWKWTILALHNALQGFMVWALPERDVIREKIDRKSGKSYRQLYDEWVEQRREVQIPNDLLDTFLGLYKKIKSVQLMESRRTGGKRFVPLGTEGRSVRELNRWRNRFVHFFPSGLSIEVSVFPQICFDNVNVIKFLFSDSGHIIPNNEAQEQLTSTTIKEIKQILEKMIASRGID